MPTQSPHGVSPGPNTPHQTLVCIAVRPRFESWLVLGSVSESHRAKPDGGRQLESLALTQHGGETGHFPQLAIGNLPIAEFDEPPFAGLSLRKIDGEERAVDSRCEASSQGGWFPLPCIGNALKREVALLRVGSEVLESAYTDTTLEGASVLLN